MNYWNIINPFLVSFLVTLLSTPIFIFFLTKLHILDDPRDPRRKNHPGLIHKIPIPRGGGIPLYIGILFSSILFLPFQTETIAILAASFLALFIGIIDDKLNAHSQDVSPYIRLLVNIVCAVIVVGNGISIDFITNPFSTSGGVIHLDYNLLPLFGFHITLAQIISIFWIIWVMNMLNWSKGIDGQMPGILVVASIVIGVVSFEQSVDPKALLDAQLSFILAGASLGFLLFNFHPAKIFPGYGATAAYLILAVVSMLSSAKLATAILVLGVPSVDAIFTIGRRLFTKRSPLLGDNKHLYHLFLKLGYSQRQIALFYWALSAILGLASLTLQSRSKLFAIIMLITIVGMILFFLHYVLRNSNEESTS